MTFLKRGLPAFEAIINGMFGVLLYVMMACCHYSLWSDSFRGCQQVTKV